MTSQTFREHISIKVIQEQEVSKGQDTNFGLGGMTRIFKTFSPKAQKTTPEPFWNGPNQTKYGNQEDTGIPGNSMKNYHCLPSRIKIAKLVIFHDINSTFCTQVHQTCSFT